MALEVIALRPARAHLTVNRRRPKPLALVNRPCHAVSKEKKKMG